MTWGKTFDLSSITDFDDNDPDPCLGLQPLEADNFTFGAFLNRMPEMFEYSAGKITNFNASGGRIFLDLGQILVYYFKERRRFSGDVLNRVRISTEWNVSHPFSSQKPGLVPFSSGIRTDLKHFRRLVVKVLMRAYPGKSASEIWEKLSNTFRLFFAPEFLDVSIDNDFAILQVLHPIFFNSNQRMNFLHIMQRFRTDNPFHCSKMFKPFLEPAFGFTQWWTKIPVLSHCQAVLRYKNNFRELYRGKPENLPLFLRNVPHHAPRGMLAKHRGVKAVAPKHIDRMLHVLFPGVCEVVLEGYLLYGRAKGIRLLSEYLVSEPYGFIIKPYRFYEVDDDEDVGMDVQLLALQHPEFI